MDEGTEAGFHGSPEALVRAALAHGVRDQRVLDALRRVPRAGFVPRPWARVAYNDRPIPIAHDQVTSQPSLIAQMLASLRLTGTERVLEVGTGLGFQTALLAMLAREVFSVERFEALAEEARANLAGAGIGNATVVVGDGTAGLAEHAPYGGIVVSAAAPRVPPPLIDQLAMGGRIVQPIGRGGGELVVVFAKHGDRLVEEATLVPASFVPLVGHHGLPERPPG